MEGSTTESVGASTAEISGVFGRGVVENESLAAFGEVKCAGRSGGSGKGRHGFAARGAARGVVVRGALGGGPSHGVTRGTKAITKRY